MKYAAAALALLVLALALRVPFATGLPDTPDSLRLVRGVQHFDVADQAPHFPGYPLAVFLARGLPTAGGRALALLSAAGGALGVLFLAVLLRRPLGTLPAFLGAALVAVSPFACLESLRVGTDALFLPFLFAALWLLDLPRGGLAGGVLLGLGLGLRPSGFAWCAALLAAPDRRRATAGLLLGTGAWLLPALAVTGPALYGDTGLHFLNGHFFQWGDTLPVLWRDRPRLVLQNWLLHPLHLPHASALAVFAVTAALGAALLARNPAPPAPRLRRHRPVVWGAAAYLVWILVGQNPHHPRHALPLVLLALALAGALLVQRRDTRGARWPAFLGCFLVMGYSSWRTVSEYRESRPPALEAAEYLLRSGDFDLQRDVLYAGADALYFECTLPGALVRARSSPRDVARDVQALPVAPRRVWWTAAAAAGSPETRVASFTRSPWLADFAPRAELFSAPPEGTCP